MKERTRNALRGMGVAAALGVMAMAGWHVMNAPAPDAHVRPLAAGGRVTGIDGWPLLPDGDGAGEVVFWRAASGTLVALDAESGDYVWESAAVSGGSAEGRAWATREALFVADADGGFSGLNLSDGRQRFRRELGERASALCRARDGLWVTLASGRTLGLDVETGRDLGDKPAPQGAARLRDCEPIWGDRLPDRGAARIAEPSEWAKVLGSGEQVAALAPQPLPDELSPSVSAYLDAGGAPSWVLYGSSRDETRGPILARVGTRRHPLANVWAKPVANGHPKSAFQRGPLLAVTLGAAFVAFFLEGERHARVARFDLSSGQRRWEITLAPRSLASIGASGRHVVLTWSGGSLADGVRQQSDFALMVLNAQTGDEVSRIGYATHSR